MWCHFFSPFYFTILLSFKIRVFVEVSCNFASKIRVLKRDAYLKIIETKCLQFRSGLHNNSGSDSNLGMYYICLWYPEVSQNWLSSLKKSLQFLQNNFLSFQNHMTTNYALQFIPWQCQKNKTKFACVIEVTKKIIIHTRRDFLEILLIYWASFRLLVPKPELLLRCHSWFHRFFLRRMSEV